MSKTPPNTVFTSGADAGDVLVGFHKSGNRGLLVQVFESQPIGEGGRLRGEFLVLHEGTGEYSSGIRAVIDKTHYFDNADDFIRRVSSQPGCRDCTHALNLNALWKLDVPAVYERIINVEGANPSTAARPPTMNIRRCRECGKIYDDMSLNFCLDDGTQLKTEPAEVETIAMNRSDFETDSWTSPRHKRTESREGKEKYGYIRDAVNRHPNLKLKSHKGFNHRILKQGYVGSMWIIPRGKGVSITVNGQSANQLYQEMERLLGRPHREDVKGYRYFQADQPSDVARVIEAWSKV